MDAICDMVREVRSLGLETCMTLGMLTDDQAQKLADAGLDYYNHNLDTSPEYYEKVVQTRSYDARLATLSRVRDAGINTSRSEERRVGTECVSTGRCRWWRDN